MFYCLASTSSRFTVLFLCKNRKIWYYYPRGVTKDGYRCLHVVWSYVVSSIDLWKKDVRFKRRQMTSHPMVTSY